MNRRARLMAAVLMVSALGGTAAASLAGGGTSPRARAAYIKFDKIDFFHFTSGAYRGIVTVAQRSATRGQVGVSLQLFSETAGPGASIVAASTQPCSKTASSSSKLFTIKVTPASGADHVFKVANVSLAQPLAKAATVRLYSLSNGKATQRGCGVAVVDNLDVFQ